MREHSMGHIKPPIWPPSKTIEQFVPIIQSKTCQQHGPSICHVIMICVLQEEKIRRLPYVNPTIAQQDSRGQVQAIGKDGHFVGTAIVVRVLKNLDAVAR